MKFVVIDLEYFSLSNAKSSYKNLKKFQKVLYPEIFQLGCIQFNTESKKKIKTLCIMLCNSNRGGERLQN